MMDLNTNKVLSALSYFSVLFAGFIFPIIVYFVSDDERVKSHAKKAFLSHLIPLIVIPIVIIAVLLDLSTGTDSVFPIFMFLGVGIGSLLSLIVVVWNIIKGVKVLQNE
ncbi:DUF4870 domain-containing protein [Pseudoneobacillus sp. C159]